MIRKLVRCTCALLVASFALAHPAFAEEEEGEDDASEFVRSRKRKRVSLILVVVDIHSRFSFRRFSDCNRLSTTAFAVREVDRVRERIHRSTSSRMMRSRLEPRREAGSSLL